VEEYEASASQVLEPRQRPSPRIHAQPAGDVTTTMYNEETRRQLPLMTTGRRLQRLATDRFD